MKYTSIDKIVRGFLLQRRWPVHFYVECIAYAQRCFAELHFYTLKNVRTVPLSLNSYGAAQLPCDYLDYCKIGVMAGNMIRPIYQRQGINRLNNIDQATGKKCHTRQTIATIYIVHGRWAIFHGLMTEENLPGGCTE